MTQRASGILVHPTSFPGKFGIGDLGSGAYRFMDFLARAKQSLWQILPIVPTSYGDSPYSGLSAFAGNPLLISVEILEKEGYIAAKSLEDTRDFPEDYVDYPRARAWKMELLEEAFANFSKHAKPQEKQDFESFCKLHQEWLEDFACYVPLKAEHHDQPWNAWTTALSLREPAALNKWKTKNEAKIEFQKFLQYQFFRQWKNLKTYANERGIRIIGDIPIFVAYDSADVWAKSNLFTLDSKGNSTVVAGVPPDYFSSTGQRWGNPLYRWDVMEKNGYQWWKDRIKCLLDLVDIIRIDHFRGFEAFWEIPATEPTAMNGKWVKGPGIRLFDALKNSMGKLPIIAEDLGVITPEVEALRDESGFPGMKILHFAFFNGKNNPYLPFQYDKNTVVYTGTHDNNTTRGWFREIGDEDRQRLNQYAGYEINEYNVCEALIRMASASTSLTAIIPLQDVMNLGEQARMNYPGKAEGNWKWRYCDDMLTDSLADWLAHITDIYQRG
ncbi:MAG: 4-alpha-glucanotransferase [SAR324 cluster bacterium]|nr:4-alpha-glucanotransferase [SAR324 cluster bacterium]